MRWQRRSKVVVMGAMLGLACLGSIANAGTRVAWDGWLIDGTTVLDGQYDLRFRLFNTEVGGSKLGNDVFKQNEQVSQGYFSATLDFGVDVFDGQIRYVEVAFRLGNLNDPYPYKVLNAPREPLIRTDENILAQNICIGTSYADSGMLTVNGDVHVTSGSNVVLKAAGDDPGDIIFQAIDGTQKARIWSAPTAGEVGLYLSTSPDNIPHLTIEANGLIRWGVGSLLYPDGGMELRSNGGIPGIDFTNDMATDYDMRLILTGNDELLVQGGTLRVEGPVQAQAYYTGDIFFQKDGQKVWRMFEDEAGLYVESLTTGKKYNVMLQELGSTGSADAEATMAGLKTENAALKQRMADLETKLISLAEKLR